MKRKVFQIAILAIFCSLLFACSGDVGVAEVRQQDMVVGVTIALTETAPPVPTLEEPELAPPLLVEPETPAPTPVPAIELAPDLPEATATVAPPPAVELPPTAVPPQVNQFMVSIDPSEPAQPVVIYALKMGGGEERADYYFAESDAENSVVLELPPGGYVFFAYSQNFFQDNGYFGAWLPEGGFETFVSESGNAQQAVVLRRPTDACNPDNQILYGAPDSRFPPTAPGGMLPTQCQGVVESPPPAASPVAVRVDPGQTPPETIAIYAEIPGGGESDRFYFMVEGNGNEPLMLNLPPGGYFFYAYSTMFEDISYFAAWNPDGGLQMLGADSTAEVILSRPVDPCNTAYQIFWSSPDGRFPPTNSEDRLMRFGCTN